MPQEIPLPQSALALIDFPSRFPLKVVGNQSEFFEPTVIDLVKARCPQNESIDLSRRASKQGKYISLTITFTVYSQQQLVDIYRDLYECEHVVMSL